MGLIDVARVADEIGTSGDVWIRGAGTRRPGPHGVRSIDAPVGVESFEADEMIVSCGAGTRLAELDAVLAARGQYVNLGQERHRDGTVGGALATGWNDHLRLGRGAVRDSLLEVHIVNGRGEVVKGGGPTVKNVSGFDLCRLVVGSHGRLGAITKVILRTRPRPRATRWFAIADVDHSRVAELASHLHRPSAVLWNGVGAWICLEGHPNDIDATHRGLRTRGFTTTETTSGPDLGGFAHRWSIAPRHVIAHVAERVGSVMGEIGVGIVHGAQPPPPRPIDPNLASIHRRLIDSFDPEHRLNPGAGDALIE